jgi:hypothetical protein
MNQLTTTTPSSGIVIPADLPSLEAYLDKLHQAEVTFECSLTFTRMLQGACLAELRKIIARPGARKDLTSPNILERLNWAEYVRQRFGFSDETARTRIAMWEAGRPRLKKLAEEMQAGLSAIFDRPVSSLNPKEFEVLQTVTHKLTDGKSIRLVQEELGLFKGDAPKPLGGYHPRQGPAPTLEEQMAAMRDIAHQDFEAIYNRLHRFAFTNRKEGYDLLGDADKMLFREIVAEIHTTICRNKK